jgi:hypothetical protein
MQAALLLQIVVRDNEKPLLLVHVRQGDQIGRFFAYKLGEFLTLGVLIIAKVATNFGHPFYTVKVMYQF